MGSWSPGLAAAIFVSAKLGLDSGLWASRLFTLSSFMKCEKDQLCALLASKAYEKRNKRGLGRP